YAHSSFRCLVFSPRLPLMLAKVGLGRGAHSDLGLATTREHRGRKGTRVRPAETAASGRDSTNALSMPGTDCRPAYWAMRKLCRNDGWSVCGTRPCLKNSRTQCPRKWTYPNRRECPQGVVISRWEVVRVDGLQRRDRELFEF